MPSSLDRGGRGLGLGRLGIVPDHHVAAPRFWDQDLLHIVLERPVLVAPSKTIAAVTPESRSPQVSVIVSR
jgi:hypothetical protein